MLDKAPRLPSGNMGHSFSRVPTISVERSKFDRSHGIKTTFDADYLIPVYVDEVLPGDTFNLRMTAFARLATPVRPLMDNLYLDSFFFFVPNRLLWTNWEKHQGAQSNPGDSISYTVPTIPLPAGGPEVGSLADYMGLPTDMANALSVSALHFRAYQLIWNTFFRDENLQNSVVVDTDDGPDTYADYALRKRGKRHDYFTSCLPWAQKGSAVSLSSTVTVATGTSQPVWRRTSDDALWGDPAGNSPVNSRQTTGVVYVGSTDAYLDPAGSLITQQTIADLRQSFMVQALLERDARGGTRYVEMIWSQFGVKSPDYRLQRPEYLGGGSSPINIHPIPQTSPTSGSNPQGQLAAFGTASIQGHGFNKSFTEHGVLLGLVQVRGDQTYSQGVERMWSRSTRYDFFVPALAHLSEQAVLNQEIYADLADGTASNQRSGVFGYQERYGEYRYKPSKITGVFRPAYATPLDTWHVSEEFSSQPSLNSTFIESNTPLDRVIAVPSEPHILFDGYFNLTCARPMPLYGVPGMGPRL